MPGSVLLSHEEPHTIIGAVWFHGRVREGIGWVTYAIAARQELVFPPTPHTVVWGENKGGT